MLCTTLGIRHWRAWEWGTRVWASEETCVLESLSWSLPPFPNSGPIEKLTLNVGEFIGESFLGYAGPGPSSHTAPGLPRVCVSLHQSSAVWVLSCVVRGVKSSQWLVYMWPLLDENPLQSRLQGGIWLSKILTQCSK